MTSLFAEVYYLGENTHSLEIHSTCDISAYRVYYTKDPIASIHEEQFVSEGSGKELVFTWNVKFDQPYYFTIAFNDGTTCVCGYRILPIAGMYNFRDIGGFPAMDGKYVKWGLLYRGDHLHNMVEEGAAYLHALHLKAIVDFRGEQECAGYPNKFVDKDCVQYHFVPDGRIAAFAGSLQNNENPSTLFQIEHAREQMAKDPDFASKSMIQQQIEFVHNEESQKAYRDMLNVMAQEQSTPLFFHCKGGKDRTGYGAMLLLSILGVDEEFIYYDYLLTNRARAKKNQRYLENFRKMAKGDEAVAQFLFSMFDTRKEYLQAAIETIKKEYGTIDHYIRKVLKISESEIEQIRSLYLV